MSLEKLLLTYKALNLACLQGNIIEEQVILKTLREDWHAAFVNQNTSEILALMNTTCQFIDKLHFNSKEPVNESVLSAMCCVLSTACIQPQTKLMREAKLRPMIKQFNDKILKTITCPADFNAKTNSHCYTFRKDTFAEPSLAVFGPVKANYAGIVYLNEKATRSCKQLKMIQNLGDKDQILLSINTKTLSMKEGMIRLTADLMQFIETDTQRNTRIIDLSNALTYLRLLAEDDPNWLWLPSKQFEGHEESPLLSALGGGLKTETFKELLHINTSYNELNIKLLTFVLESYERLNDTQRESSVAPLTTLLNMLDNAVSALEELDPNKPTNKRLIELRDSTQQRLAEFVTIKAQAKKPSKSAHRDLNNYSL